MITYNPDNYPLPLTDEQQAELLALGQAEADRQMLETLLDDNAAMYIAVGQMFGVRTDDLAQEWRAIPTIDNDDGL